MPIASSLATFAEELRRRINDWIERNPEGAARIALWMEDQLERPDGVGAPANLLQSFLETFVPRNWWYLGVGVHERARKVMAESGICLIWVPPAEVVGEITRAGCKEERDGVLVANSELILDAADEVLTEARHPRLDVTVAAAQEAVDAHRAGCTMAAQSLAAAVLSEVVERHFGFNGFGSARIAFEDEPASAAGLWSFRRAAVQEAILVAIMRSEDRPSGAGFNRHLSVHGVDPQQFREPHALEGIMLLAGAVRELHEIYRVAERGFGPSPHLNRHATAELMRRVEAARSGQQQFSGSHDGALPN